MPHEVGKERDVVAAVEEAFRKAVPEGMGINYQRVYAIAQPQPFQLAGNAAGGDALPVLIKENKAAVLFLVPKPGKRFVFSLRCGAVFRLWNTGRYGPRGYAPP